MCAQTLCIRTLGKEPWKLLESSTLLWLDLGDVTFVFCSLLFVHLNFLRVLSVPFYRKKMCYKSCKSLDKQWLVEQIINKIIV